MRRRAILTMAAILGMVGGLASGAWAGGGVNLDPPSCQENNTAGAIAIRGTVSVEALSTANGSVDADFTARLTRSGAAKFFHFTLFTKVSGQTNEQVLCAFLEVRAFAEKILGDLGLDTTKRLFITDKSVTNAEVQGPDSEVLNSSLVGVGRGSGMADVTIYAK
jgi:hypothetical protein